MIRVKRNDVMSYECQELQNAANDVDLTLEERDEAAEQLERLADAKDAHAQYIIGTAYRNGGLLILDTVKAQNCWNVQPRRKSTRRSMRWASCTSPMMPTFTILPRVSTG